jgi:DNA-binding MarR family transcriptional regulator
VVVQPELEALITASGLDPICCVLRHVTHTSRTIVAAFDAALSPIGVTAHQFTVLMALAHAGPLNIAGLAGAVGMHPSTTPRLIAPLTRDGLVRVRPGADRRERIVGLTPKGHKAVLRGYPRWADVQRDILQHLGPGRWPSVMQTLEAIRTALDTRAGR